MSGVEYALLTAPVYLTPDGTRIVLAVPTDLDSVVPLTLVTNWR